MTWSEEVALIFLQLLRDPELIRYLLDIAKPIHLNFISEEARDFHVSLRMTREKRWGLTRDLCKMRKFNLMNSKVPITCTLPFDDGMWSRSCKILKALRYFRHGFIRGRYIADDVQEDRDLELPLKIKVVNLINDSSPKGSEFRMYFIERDISEAVCDLEIYEDMDLESGIITPSNELPYLLIDKSNDNVNIIDIYN
jgi:hypothetical protein